MITIQRTDLRNRWAVLGPSSDSELFRSSTLTTDSGDKLRVAVDQVGNRHLLVPVHSSDRRVPEDVVGAVLVDRRPIAFESTTTYFLDVQCVRTDLFDLFDDLVLKVIEVVNRGGGADAAIEVIDRERILLATRAREKLSLSKQRGLLAELYILGLTSPSNPIDVSTWRGPLKAPHDIVTGTYALEVKSVGGASRHIEIHGAEQLTEPGKPLALVIVELSEDATGQSIAEAADDLLRRADNPGLAESRLQMAGYSIVDAADYTTRFKVQQVRYLEVNDQTPRIVAGSFANSAVPYGIVYLTYVVDLAALQGLLIAGETAVGEWITRQTFGPAT